jgi:hypothetical protein
MALTVVTVLVARIVALSVALAFGAPSPDTVTVFTSLDFHDTNSPKV